MKENVAYLIETLVDELGLSDEEAVIACAEAIQKLAVNDDSLLDRAADIISR